MNPATNRRAASRPDSGFTILETVIALFIALVMGFGAISLFLFSANFNAGASDRARALALAQQRMETYRATPYANLVTTNTTERVDVGSTEVGRSDRRTFTVATTVEYDTDVPTNKQRIVTVTVTPVANGRWTAGAVVLKLLRASDDVGNN